MAAKRQHKYQKIELNHDSITVTIRVTSVRLVNRGPGLSVSDAPNTVLVNGSYKYANNR